MQKVLTAEQMREVDRLTTERYGIPSILLMENAAHAVARVITEKLGGSVVGKRALILVGRGNNGGDGLAIARILHSGGCDVTVCMMYPDQDFNGDALANLQILRKLHKDQSVSSEPTICFAETGTHRVFFDNADPYFGPDVVIDALFGTGLTRPLAGADEEVARSFRAVFSEQKRPLLLSVDLPSGLSGDSAELLGEAFAADLTITFTSPKPATVLPPASNQCGELLVANIGSPAELIRNQPSKLYLACEDDAIVWLKASKFTDASYKNKRGHTLIVAGSPDYSGAAALSGNSAMRSGVGLVTLACPGNAKAEIASRLLPDVILKTIESHDAKELAGGANAIAVGCGLDANDRAIEGLVRQIVEDRKVPVIVDAGALWFFSPSAENHPVGEAPPPLLRKDGSLNPPLILTPHEGEFMRLLGTSDKEAIKDRVAAVRDFATTNNVILVLKGERVLIGSSDGRVVVNPTGNSGLGKAGNGDTLTGILAGFVAQASALNIDIFETVVAAVYVAGMAGDVAEKKYGKRVMTASDVRECLVDVFAALSVSEP